MKLPLHTAAKPLSLIGIWFLMLMSVVSVKGQIIWQEDFSYPDGTTLGANNNTANPAADWTSQCTTCVSGDWFEVRSNRMEGLDVNGAASLETEVIDISSYPLGVEILIDLEEAGSMEGCPGGTSSGCNSVDWIRIEYSIDGGPYADFTSPFGGPCSGGCAGATYVTFGDFGAFTFEQCPITGDDLRLRISVQCWAANEFLFIDNIIIQAQSCNPMPTDSLINLSCNGSADGEIWVFPQTFTPPFTYSLNGGTPQDSNSFTGLSAGTYFVVIEDGSGQLDTISGLVLTEPSALNLSLSVTDSDCDIDNGNIATSVSGGTGAYSYAWNTTPPQSSATATGLSGSSYTVTVTDANGCTIEDSATVFQGPIPVVTAFGGDTLCAEEGGVQLGATASGGLGTLSFAWSCDTPTPGCGLDSLSDDDPFADPATTTTYYVQVTDSTGCMSAPDSTIVTIQPAPSLNLGADREVCEGTLVSLDAGNPGMDFLWSTAETSQAITISSNGTYWVQVTNAAGCVSSDTLDVTFVILPIIDLGPDTVLCEAPDFTLDADPMSLYPTAAFSWSNGAVGSAITVSSTGSYAVAVAQGTECVGTDTIDLIFSRTPQVELGPDTTLCQDEEFFLDADPLDLFSDAEIIWNTGDLSDRISISSTDVYSVSLLNECGFAEDSVYVELSETASGVFVPNAFTPNGDGLNDEFQPIGIESERYYVAIFDRWGKMVFETNNSTVSWDGTVNGTALPDGAYVYLLRVNNCNGVLTTRGGSLMLYR